MQILAIETATDVCSVALVQEDSVLAETTIYEPRRHAELLAPVIEEQFKRHDLSVSSLDAVAVSIGPGSFTGLRIGLSTAKGLIFGTKIQLLAVPTLLASAWGVREQTHHVGVIHHSHRDFYFYAEYEFGEKITTKYAPCRIEFPEIQKVVDDELALVCRVPGNDKNVGKLSNRILSKESVRASYLGQLAAAYPDKWTMEDPFIAEPEYLKEYKAVKYTNPVAK